jgi:hypothetical protein
LPDQYKYEVVPKPKTAAELQELLTQFGDQGYELWPLITNCGSSENLLIFQKNVYGFNVPLEDRVERLLSYVVQELFPEPKDLDEAGTKKLREILTLVIPEV